jgi:hypothetical protein
MAFFQAKKKLPGQRPDKMSGMSGCPGFSRSKFSRTFGRMTIFPTEKCPGVRVSEHVPEVVEVDGKSRLLLTLKNSTFCGNSIFLIDLSFCCLVEFFSIVMTALEEKINALETRIIRYETELDNAIIPEEKNRLSGLITSSQEVLKLLLEKEKSQSTGKFIHS